VIEVRTATRDDVEALAAIYPAVHDKHVRANPWYHKPLAPGAARRLAEGLFEREGMHVFLVTLDGDPVGFVAAILGERPERDATHGRKVVFVDTIAVKDSVQRRGCGKALIDAAVAMAREAGATSVELEVWDFNAQARAFFAAEGFGPMYARLRRPVP
jgi:ribosomal protein S18 acetylase RimI-like enzyme